MLISRFVHRNHRSELKSLATSKDKIVVVARDELALDPIVEAVQAAGFEPWQGPGSRSHHTTKCTGFYVLYTPTASRAAKSALIYDLEKYPEVRLLVGLTGSLVEGKNLQMCNRMFVLDPV